LHFRKSSLELRDQARQGFGLLIRGEVTAGQPLDLEAELAQSFLRDVNLPVFKGIFVAAANQERELTAVSLKELSRRDWKQLIICPITGHPCEGDLAYLCPEYGCARKGGLSPRSEENF
jgi:hypothetical protein